MNSTNFIRTSALGGLEKLSFFSGNVTAVGSGGDRGGESADAVVVDADDDDDSAVFSAAGSLTTRRR